jgi:hypothetical protein
LTVLEEFIVPAKGALENIGPWRNPKHHAQLVGFGEHASETRLALLGFAFPRDASFTGLSDDQFACLNLASAAQIHEWFVLQALAIAEARGDADWASHLRQLQSLLIKEQGFCRNRAFPGQGGES